MNTEDTMAGRTIPCSEWRSASGPHTGRALKYLFLLVILGIAQSAAANEATCGTLRNAYGPFDYRSASMRQIQLVEDYHFTPDVEMLKHGKSGLTVGGDLNYTLRAFPNHYRALVAMMNLGLIVKKKRPPGAEWPVECYFDRAIRFRPDDGTVRTIFGVYKLSHGKPTEAIAQFEMAAKLGDDSGNLHYNAGLAYFELGDYDNAVAHAKKAADLGFGLSGLRDKLTKAGKWPTD